MWQIPTKKDQGSRDNWRFQYWILNLSTMAGFWHEICVWYRFWGEEYEVEKYIGQTGGKGANSKIPNSCAFFSIWGFVNTYTIITFTTRGRQYHAREISTLILKYYFSTCKPSFQKRLVQHSSVVLDLSYLMGVLFNRRPDYQTTQAIMFSNLTGRWWCAHCYTSWDVIWTAIVYYREISHVRFIAMSGNRTVMNRGTRNPHCKALAKSWLTLWDWRVRPRLRDIWVLFMIRNGNSCEYYKSWFHAVFSLLLSGYLFALGMWILLILSALAITEVSNLLILENTVYIIVSLDLHEARQL